MITAKEAREIAMDMAQDQAWYASINADRMRMKRQYFQVNDRVCFEYWGKHEWEFTISCEEEDEATRQAYYAVIFAVTAYMNTINVTMTRIPALLAKCRAQLASIDKAVA